jgi:hypothetical protein
MKTRIAPLALAALASLAFATGGCTQTSGEDPGTAPASSPTEGAHSAQAGQAAQPATAGEGPKFTGPPFQGKLNLRISGGGKDLELVVTAAASKIRVDFPSHRKGETQYSIYDPGTRARTVVADASRTATTSTAPTAAWTPVSIHKTGARETLSGHACENWDVVDVRGRHETLCVAEGFGQIDLGAAVPAELGGPAFGPWLSGLQASGELPLRAIVSDGSGAIESQLTVMAIDTSPAEEAAVAVPRDYHQLTR